MIQVRNNKKKAQEEKELVQTLAFSIFGIIVTIVVVFLSATVFAPEMGAFFGYLSLNKGQVDDQLPIKPSAPVFVDTPSATKSLNIDIKGVTQPGFIVEIFVNGPKKGSVVADKNGEFNFAKVTLIEGKNRIYAKAINDEGIESDKSQTLEITVDRKAPEIEIESPKEGETVRNLDGRIQITGKVNEKASIRINDRQAITKSDLTFSILLGVDEGDVEIKIEAIDEAGNKSEETYVVKYSKGS